MALFREALGMMKTQRGPDHPDTLYAMHNLAFSCFQAGNEMAAIARGAKVELGEHAERTEQCRRQQHERDGPQVARPRENMSRWI